MPTNNLETAIQTSVKFYASLTRNQAKGIDSIGNNANGDPIYVEPGAVCFVSDEAGNSIFLNTRLFGDGATAGSISGGGGSGSGDGITEVHLSDLAVVELNGQILKTLADYFQADGTFVTDGMKVYATRTNPEGTEYQIEMVVINDQGITVGGSRVITEDDLNNFKNDVLGDASGSAQDLANAAEQNAKDYADSLLTSVYKIKGSVTTYSDLLNLIAPKAGDVYNVIQEYGIQGTSDFIPAGTNYVYVAVTNTSDSKYPGYWDALGGTINLSAYKTSANTTAEINEALQSAKTYADGLKTNLEAAITVINNALVSYDSRLSTITGTLNTLSTEVSINTGNIETNTTNISNIVTQLTWQ